ncbi:MAG: beta-propeller fold lactonase family protein [Rhizobiaceae bacterium]|nr:beta-propeller fold lactonase family protein [Rhizobiaceae bacterium]
MKTTNTKRPARAIAAVSTFQASISRRIALAALATASALALLGPLAAEASAETASAGVVYTADEYGNSVSRIDLAAGKVEIVPVAVTPHNVQFVPKADKLLAVGTPVGKEGGHGHAGTKEEAGHAPAEDGHGGDGHGGSEAGGALIVLDPESLASGPVPTIDVGSHPAHVIADPAGERAFVSNSGDDTVSVIELATGRTVTEIATGDYPHGLRMSPDGGTIYVANVEDGTVSVIDVQGLNEMHRIEVGKAPVQVGFTPDGSRVYVSLRDENKVAVINTATLQVTDRIDVGRSPIQMHATPDGKFVYVANQGSETEPDETVSVIDVASGDVVKTITTGKGAHGVTVSDDGAHVFVTNILDGTVSEISVATQSVVRTHEVGKGPNGITFQAQ